jgi:hypothetical protein
MGGYTGVLLSAKESLTVIKNDEGCIGIWR